MESKLLAVSALFAVLFQLASSASTSEFTSIRQLPNGPVRGLITEVEKGGKKVEFYQGIKFGQAGRFEKPSPVHPWTKVYNATQVRNACPQFGILEAASMMTGNANQSEDCLFLNVWVPTGEPKTNRSVMVWIHGGAFEVGSIWPYDGKYIAAAGDLIVVSIAYRLGPFGFLSGPGVPPNLGLHDQIAGLRWVQENIEAFGGAKDAVTIFGESAGSMSVGALVLSPLAKGLFHRAIAQSGAPLCDATATFVLDALKRTATFAERVHCPAESIIHCLKSKSIHELQTASKDDLSRNELFIPVYGDEVLPLKPSQALVKGEFNQVDFLYGTTRDEGTGFLGAFFPELGARVTNVTVDSAKAYIVKLMRLLGQGGVAGEVADYYIDKLKNHTQDDLKIAISSAWADFYLVCPSILFGEELARRSPASKHIYSYRLMQVVRNVTGITGLSQPAGFEWRGVNHGQDLSYLFTPQYLKLVPELGQLSQTMISSWTSFAKTGTPSLSNWTQAVNRKTGDFSTRYMHLESGHYRMVGEQFKENCDKFWKPKLQLEKER